MNQEEQDRLFMQRCLDLARNGLGATYPNPMVGSVVVCQGQIIGEGYHKKAGEPHAEVNAIASVKDKELLKKSTLYVNLEPCSHFGKTPPCSDLIIEKKIPHVVIACLDSFPEVSGRGMEKLQKSGCKVSLGLLGNESRELNKRFFTFHEKQRPYIVLKWAQSADAFIDVQRTAGSPVQPTWISSEAARALVHKWRSEEQAVMVGTNTAEKDNPRLNVRDWTGRNPIRIVIDRSLRLRPGLHLFDRSIPTLVFTEQKRDSEMNPEYIRIDFNADLPYSILRVLHERQIQSVFIEGGSILLQSFIGYGLWDEARVFTGEGFFGAGVPAPFIKGKVIFEDNIAKSRLTVYRND